MQDFFHQEYQLVFADFIDQGTTHIYISYIISKCVRWCNIHAWMLVITHAFRVMYFDSRILAERWCATCAPVAPMFAKPPPNQCLANYQKLRDIPSQSLTRNLKMAPCNRRFLLETITLRFHVELGECMMLVAEILRKPARWAQKPFIYKYRIITPPLIRGK